MMRACSATIAAISSRTSLRTKCRRASSRLGESSGCTVTILNAGGLLPVLAVESILRWVARFQAHAHLSANIRLTFMNDADHGGAADRGSQENLSQERDPRVLSGMALAVGPVVVLFCLALLSQSLQPATMLALVVAGLSGLALLLMFTSQQWLDGRTAPLVTAAATVFTVSLAASCWLAYPEVRSAVNAARGSDLQGIAGEGRDQSQAQGDLAALRQGFSLRRTCTGSTCTACTWRGPICAARTSPS
jgi:hypothetical protein